MPYPTKKQRLEGHPSALVAAYDGSVASFDDDPPPARRSRRIARRPNAHFDDLSVDVLPNVLGFLLLEDIMRSRRINKKTREAVRKTIVPLTNFSVESVVEYNAMRVMTEAMPNLQQIDLRGFGWWSNSNKWSEGEDPDEERAARTAHKVSHDIGIISNFGKLRILTIGGLNGRYPFLFNSFQLLQKLSLQDCYYLKWDLEMLAGMPLLTELDFDYNKCLAGNISSLRVLKDTLEKVKIHLCARVEGNFMDLADFPHLKELNLDETAITGDIRDIGDNDFASLERLILPKGVYGGRGYELQSISDAPDLVRSLYLLKKRRPTLAILKEWHGELSADSPDWYESEIQIDDSFQFFISFVKAGSRIGYRWESSFEGPCEVNWLDPEPDRESSDYGKYFKEMCNIDGKVKLYKGFHQPPTEEEYHRLLDERAAREESGSESDESNEGYSSEQW